MLSFLNRFFLSLALIGLCLLAISLERVDASDKIFCQNVPEVFKSLVNKLIADGLEANKVCAVFENRQIRFNPKVMPRKVVHSEASLPYKSFLEASRIKRAKRYLQANEVLLNEVERQFGVPKEIKVAILLVETDLGRYLGSTLAVNTLASMAVASDLDSVKPFLPEKYKRLSKSERSKLNKKLKRKSKWAYGELKSLFRYAEENGLDIFSIKGSIFGAIGLCQFMPSNAIKFGVDFNKDGIVNLFEPADALASMANYLKYFGWKNNLSWKGKMRVIMHYNHSRPYARTVLEIAKRVGSI